KRPRGVEIYPNIIVRNLCSILYYEIDSFQSHKTYIQLPVLISNNYLLRQRFENELKSLVRLLLSYQRPWNRLDVSFFEYFHLAVYILPLFALVKSQVQNLPAVFLSLNF